MNSINKNTVFVLVVLILALGIGMWRCKQPTGPQKANLFLGEPLQHVPTNSQAKILPPFQFTEALSNQPFTQENFQKKWSFLFFGYSSCPDVCPKTIGTLNKVAANLKNHPGVQYLFISIDPKKDNLKTLSAFLKQEKFQPSFVKGLTGDKEQVMALAGKIGIFVDENPSQPALSGPIEHSGTIVLINPKGALAGIFSQTDSPEQIAQGFQKVYQQFASLNRIKPVMPS